MCDIFLEVAVVATEGLRVTIDGGMSAIGYNYDEYCFYVSNV
jgi:hypothetical protein